MKNKLPFILRFSVLSLAMGCCTHLALAQSLLSYQKLPDHFLASKSEDPSTEKQNKSLRSVLEELQSTYNIYFTYDADVVQDKIVSKSKDNSSDQKSLEQLLSTYLAPLHLNYKKIKDNYYVIYAEKENGRVIKLNSRQPGAANSLQSSGLAIMRFNTDIKKFEKTISGKVTDESDNSGLPGVNIIAKGTTIGTVTDVDGNYRVNVPDNTTILVFSSVGYQTKEISIGDQSVINVNLGVDVQSLSEVVVVGYGEQKKVTVTGAVASVKGEELVKSPVVNLSNSLAGRIPGLSAVNRSGEPGYDGSSIRIRGSNTTGNNNALIVVDGIPARAGGLDRINPMDIESISVLKDASAAIYGARAANGVILITTKRGKTGKPQLSYSFNQGWAQPTVVPEMADAVQFGEMRNSLEIYNLPVEEWNAANSSFKENGSYLRPNGSLIEAPYGPDDFNKFKDGSDPWGHPNTDWFDATLKTWSPQSQHNLQLTGGSENFKYLASLGYQNQDAFYKDAATGYKQYDMRINLDGNINKYIKTSIGLLARQEKRFFPTVSAGQIFRMQMRGIPTSPAFWPNGLPGPDIENGTNPVVVTTNQTGYDRDTRNYLQTNGTLEISIPGVEGLKVTGTASVDKYIKQSKTWNTPWYLYTWDRVTYEADGTTPLLVKGARGPAEPNLNQGTEDQLNILLGATVNYEHSFGDHNLTFLAGTNRETIDFSSFNAYRRYFISPAIDQIFAGGDAEKNNGGSAWERARLNYFGRVAYNYKEKYLTEFLWRYDGSYMFPENTRFGFFPGVLAGWVISEENFWKDNISFMDYVKIRGSWGQMGNDYITEGWDDNLLEYQYLSTYGFRSYIIGGQEVKTLYETRVPNKSITWEVANNTNLGLEGQMLEGKVFFEFELFWNKRTNMLRRRFGSIPQSTGMTLPPENIGEVRNKGWEFNVGYNGQAGELSYSISANGGYAQNEILFWDEAPGVPAWQQTTGSPMYTYLLYQYDGVFKDQADIDANTIDYSSITNTLRPGDMKYKDVHGTDGDPNPDGKITPDDQIRNEFTNLPLFQGGINLSARYKNFDLAILFQAATGAKFYINTESGSIGNYLLYDYERQWTIDNPSDTYPRIADRANQWYSGGNTYWLRNADYIRMKNFEIGYTIPFDFTERIGINNLRVYANGLNLFTIDKFNIFDPEAGSSSGQYYPQSRIINLGATVTF